VIRFISSRMSAYLLFLVSLLPNLSLSRPIIHLTKKIKLRFIHYMLGQEAPALCLV
jgi:hypothetical protein